jgi:hypothetical protein
MKGIRTLLKFAIERYKQTKKDGESTSIISAWNETKNRLAEIQKQQFYNNNEKEFLNSVRTLYYNDKTKKKYDIE